jgi:allantoinase
MTPRFVRSRRVVLPDGEAPATLRLAGGTIEAVLDHAVVPEGPGLDVGTLVVMPGLVDSHVHVNEPGRTEWEGFDHATRAAAAGGVTTIVDMPLNSVPATVDAAALEVKRQASTGQCWVDVGFWGGVVPGNAAQLEPLARAGALGFKCFLAPSGVDEFPHVGLPDLREALPILARLDLPLLVHAELPSELRAPAAGADPRSYRTWLETRSARSETAAVELLVALAEEYRARVHVVHVSSPATGEIVRRARARGVHVSCETCPHYLMFCDEDVPDGATAFKCAPPVRHASDREGLWSALLDDGIQVVATDHSPATPALKELDSGSFLAAWGGIASLQLGLAVVWTAARARGIVPAALARWMSSSPAQLAGLTTKGAIAAGRDADLVIWDPDAEQVVDPAALHHRHPVTPYAGMHLHGVVLTTILRGEVIVDGGRPPGIRTGRIVTRPSGSRGWNVER